MCAKYPLENHKRFKIPQNMKNNKQNWIKYSIAFVLCFLVRLIPFRAPNIEPILTTTMPFSKAFGKYFGFSFAFLSIFLFDAVTSGIGMWTLVTAVAYGLLGLWASHFFKNKKNTSINYVKFAVMGTIVYDVITGFTVGPLFFGQPFLQAVMGQIPFTILHLIGNVSFAFFLSPIIYRFIVQNKEVVKRSPILTLKEKQA